MRAVILTSLLVSSRRLSFVAAMSTSSAAAKTSHVRVVSYNLLSSKLARPSHFTHTNPEHLEFEYRLPLILDKLDEAMKRDFLTNEEEQAAVSQKSAAPPPTIFALQEVCYPFASALHTFFAQRGYHFVTGLYGRPFNGYMGVAIAYPLKDFDTVNIDICRLSDEREDGWPREAAVIEEEGGSIVKRLTKSYYSFVGKTIQTINNRVMKRLGYKGNKAIDAWFMSENRFNVLLTATLRHRGGGGGIFAISNYHMPCAFFAPPVMNIHADMVSKRVQDLAAKSWKSLQADSNGGEAEEVSWGETKTIPYVLAGDFNIMPDSPHYKLLTTGALDKADPTYPPSKYGTEWKVQCSPMDSAYASLDGGTESEPEFTNYAHIKEDPDPFIGTLDYIFLSQKECTSKNEAGQWWKVHSLQQLPSKEDSGGPFPSEIEPSDHLLISADLELFISP